MHRSRDTNRQPPALTIGPRSVAFVVLVTLAVAAMSWWAPLLPVERSYNYQRVQDALAVEEARTLPSWWTSVLFLVMAAAALAAAGAARRRMSRLRAGAWAVVAACGAWMSMDHSVGLHSHLHYFTRDHLPGLLGRYPVEVGLVVVLVPTGLVLLGRSSALQRALLAGALTSYLVGSLLINFGVVELPFSAHRDELTEACFEWLGVLLLAFAASLERRR